MTEHFRHVVRGSGPGLLLAHGGGGSVEANFGPILGDLARTHTVVGPDYPGSGATPRSETPLDLDEVADELVAIAVGAGLERFAVLGYSLGTAVAVRAATRHPGRVTGLILTSGFARLDNRIRLAVDIWASLLHDDPRLLAKFLTLAGTGTRHLESLSPADLATAVDELAAFIPAGSPEQVGLVAQVDTRAELAAITVPALVVATTLDGLASPALSRELAAGLPHAELVEIEAGHNIGGEAPGAWLAAIEKFLGGL
ncbi:alpha/beta fold hydrolase [Amycolatopsis vancoresmycina]|uniref:Alpha/beta hydrolase fold family protein n=1 Tax=Amycolatopsis vancoresmycina DSM 44592 TaxID=1292037 RepID=R1I3Q7_9PSEU|nr:alpha/beta hydrolase [Amycolatopsis vancoresmycina]EOD65114.1 alpha/beta hydrolase fold family protein [Amycolatopsis vancoresmycina DSM 44592]